MGNYYTLIVVVIVGLLMLYGIYKLNKRMDSFTAVTLVAPREIKDTVELVKQCAKRIDKVTQDTVKVNNSVPDIDKGRI